MRFFFLINFIKKNCMTHQVTSRLKNPYQADAIMGIFLFCILPLVLTFLNIYFNHSLNYWYLIFLLLFILGTSITLISKSQRRKWKLENSAKSKLYTNGLFKYARYINYFGKTISQPALWFIATGVWWISLIALLYQLYDFSFLHIPKQDKYLLKKYGDDFKEISIHRKKFIPFIY
jgi:steroid 5-alpha reductase family enzyme